MMRMMKRRMRTTSTKTSEPYWHHIDENASPYWRSFRVRRKGSRIARALLAYAIIRGVWKGLTYKRRGRTVSEFDAILKAQWLPVIMEELERTPSLWLSPLPETVSSSPSSSS